MHKWYDSLTMGQKMGLWSQYKAEGSSDYVEKAYRDYQKQFKLEIL